MVRRLHFRGIYNVLCLSCSAQLTSGILYILYKVNVLNYTAQLLK